MRCAVLLVALFGMALAQKPISPQKARVANDAALVKALVKLKLKEIKLATVPADPEESSDDTHFVGNVVFDARGHHDPTFVVDRNKGVFRVVPKLGTLGRVKESVCHAGPVQPIRVKRTRFDVPKGHTFKGDVEVTYDVWVIDEMNTCR
jgi:hypothetical protein